VCSIQLFFTGAYCKYSIAFWTPNGKCDRNTARLHCVSVTFTCQQGSASQWKERERERRRNVHCRLWAWNSSLHSTGPCNNSSYKSPTYPCRGTGSISEESIWTTWRTTWHLDRFLSKNVYTPPVSLHQ